MFTINTTDSIQAGDKLTIAGVYPMVRNPDRKWWQVWKPRMVQGNYMQTFVATALAKYHAACLDQHLARSCQKIDECQS